MMIRKLAGFLVVVFCCCSPRRTIEAPEHENGDSQMKFKSGLKIETRINRGIGYEDPNGTDYNLRYVPITITNDSTISIHVQIAFKKEYDYPETGDNEKFKLIPLPKEWAQDGVGVSETLIAKLPLHIENPVFKETIEPGENVELAIGSLYPSPPKTSGVLPRRLFAESDIGVFPDCDWLLKKDRSSNQQIPIALEVVFEKSVYIPCGQITYPQD